MRKGKKKLRRLVHERPKKCVFTAKNLIAAPMAILVPMCCLVPMPFAFAWWRGVCNKGKKLTLFLIAIAMS